MRIIGLKPKGFIVEITEDEYANLNGENYYSSLPITRKGDIETTFDISGLYKRIKNIEHSVTQLNKVSELLKDAQNSINTGLNLFKDIKSE